MAEKRRFIAAAQDVRGRLDRFVVFQFEKIGEPVSRSAVQRWIEAGRVEVDGARGQAADRVRLDSEIVVSPLGPQTTDLAPDPSISFEVLFEDEHLVVLDKPPGLVVHPARGHATGTLVHGLLARGSFDRFNLGGNESASVRERPGIVHRLDKGTSGILVVAKDEPTREGLKALFASHRIERVYSAIVVGHAESRTYETLHGRHPVHRLKFSSRVAQGKWAVTHVRAVERLACDRATLVECRLETGRTHQIRVHLAECGHTAVLGDPLYGAPPRDPELSSVAAELGHQALHAGVLGFVHPATGIAMRFEKSPPADFRTALERLRRA